MLKPCQVIKEIIKLKLGTIGYTIDWDNIDKKKYELQLLTVVTDIRGNYDVIQDTSCKIVKHKGIAGHVLLKYPSGGQILTSCGHWIELVKLDVSKK